MSGPILLTGPDRSGTSLLYAFLVTHPQICLLRGTHLFRWFHGQFGELAVPATLERFLDEMRPHPGATSTRVLAWVAADAEGPGRSRGVPEARLRAELTS